eukprot:SAG22_NODE_616_length_8539_cov_5.330213_7_plen_131_part_00
MPSYLDLLPDELHLLVMKHVFDKCISHLKSMTIQPVRYVPHHPNTNSYCIHAWLNGIPYKRGKNFRYQGLTTDGQDLYSYGLRIGRTGAFHKKLLYDYTAKGIAYYSQTTSCHVGLARPYADTVLASNLL